MKKKSLASVMLFIGVLMFYGVEVSAHDYGITASRAQSNSDKISRDRKASDKQIKMDCSYKKNISAVLCDIVSKQPSAGVSCRQIKSMVEGC
jgi:hypothetical protein